MTKKFWTSAEDKEIMRLYEEYVAVNANATKKEIFESMEDAFKRPYTNILARYYRILSENGDNVVKISQDKTDGYDAFLSSIDKMQKEYKGLIDENKRLKLMLSEYDQLKADYETLLKVMEQARKMIANQELGEHEKTRFKMDQNGNLERIS